MRRDAQSSLATAGVERDVTVPVRDASLAGTLTLPDGARGIVVFAHGSGSSRRSPRNRYVAEELHAGGLATLLMDLLTTSEDAVDERTAEFRFDIRLLADRLVTAIDWLAGNEPTRGLGIGLFGASTGGGAALVAAARLPKHVRAVVSRGGRPDLAGSALRQVVAPTLLVVGGDDDLVIELNRDAIAEMTTTTRLEIIPGASHLFEEPGALEQVAHLARDWFIRYL